MFITFEGMEGCGKSTQARLLYQALNFEGVDAVLTREPGGCSVAEDIRNSLLIKGEFNGFGWTKNQAASFAKNDWILVVDSDEVIDVYV